MTGREADMRGNCCQCDNALIFGGHEHCQRAARKALVRLAAENRDLLEAIESVNEWLKRTGREGTAHQALLESKVTR